ncbi:FIG00931666: hypothetical protein [Polaromonas sp. CG9_12]|uniref:hypothetical protein n=1 Tax=Polaromonas sp. CG_9.11 TaxID=2787730 RepID=UPI0004DDCA0D|nr:hypothetical protein [Polaromonas sp. CG_9.11]MBG6074536.1 hypothetical protein [Polaromonas sp. CG_9.11]CDS54684.1 FIG00931666: hypothetical protein [Polaromonas sp. CG9_12]
MSYTLKLYAFEDASPQQLQAAELRFRKALDESLGDASLVAPVHAAYRRMVATYGEHPSQDILSPEELEIFTQWQAAEAAALNAALGPNRYMGDAQFEIGN